MYFTRLLARFYRRLLAACRLCRPRVLALIAAACWALVCAAGCCKLLAAVGNVVSAVVQQQPRHPREGKIKCVCMYRVRLLQAASRAPATTAAGASARELEQRRERDEALGGGETDGAAR